MDFKFDIKVECTAEVQQRLLQFSLTLFPSPWGQSQVHPLLSSIFSSSFIALVGKGPGVSAVGLVLYQITVYSSHLPGSCALHCAPNIMA